MPPAQTPLQGQGFSADYLGFPPQGYSGGGGGGVPNATPYRPPANMQPPGTPYVPPGAQTGYSTFQQPLPGYGYPMGMPPMAMATPYMPMMGGMPGMPPMQGIPQMQAMPMGMGMFTPGPVPGGVPMPGAGPAAPPMQPSHSGNGRPYSYHVKDKGPWDQVDKFAEGGDYGPVLKPLLVQKLKVKVEVNPLISPPGDGTGTEHDYLKWNMLFPTGNCQRSGDRPGRSWSYGRDAPATWPRVTTLRIISRSFPWTIDVPAQHPEVGVTCGDVIEAIHASMYTRLSQGQYDHADARQRRLLSESYWHNRSTADGVPGGRLQQTLLRFDWLGSDTWFGGVLDDQPLVRELCRCSLPCTFVLVCAKRPHLSDAEILNQEERGRLDEERHRRRSRSRATSRTASTRPPTRPPSRAPPEDSSTTSSAT
ncbi:hypothetical protein GY45DRAFT_1245353 [Cubamyces sp. BRFM 1775]|nr:hypothetical protein GY45DRAFT_1245353 [Cubamyces sp. BRFM 1775]